MPRLTLGYRVGILIAILLVSSALLTTMLSLRSVQATMSDESAQSVDNIHSSVTSLISLEYDSIEDFRTAAMDRRKAELRDLSNPVEAALDEQRAAVARGEITVEQAQANAKAFVERVRFGNNDYFYAFDSGMTQLSHPDASLVGRQLIDLEDDDGKAFVRDMQAVALDEGEGFVDYRFRRLGETDPSAKLAYVFHYEPWNWILGTGVYVDDIDEEVEARFADVKQQLADTLQDIRFGDQGFFFILDDQGEVVVAPSGRDMSALAGTQAGQQFVDQVVTAVDESGGATTTITADAALDASGRQPWVLTLSTFDALGWTLVSAVPQAELDAPARALMVQQALLTLGVLVLGLVAGLLMSRRMIRPVEDVTRAAIDLSQERFAPESLDRAARRTDEVGELARTFQRMGTEIVTRERRLREQVAKLRVEIDSARREEQVREITETDFFSDLTTKASEMRARMHDDPDET